MPGRHNAKVRKKRDKHAQQMIGAGILDNLPPRRRPESLLMNYP